MNYQVNTKSYYFFTRCMTKGEDELNHNGNDTVPVVDVLRWVLYKCGCFAGCLLPLDACTLGQLGSSPGEKQTHLLHLCWYVTCVMCAIFLKLFVQIKFSLKSFRFREIKYNYEYLLGYWCPRGENCCGQGHDEFCSISRCICLQVPRLVTW